MRSCPSIDVAEVSDIVIKQPADGESALGSISDLLDELKFISNKPTKTTNNLPTPDREKLTSGGIGAILATLFTSLVFGKKVLSKNKTIKNLDQRLSETQSQYNRFQAENADLQNSLNIVRKQLYELIDNLTPNEYELEADEEEEKLKRKILGLEPKEQTLKELTWNDKCPPKTRPKGWAAWCHARKKETKAEVHARKKLRDRPTPNMCSAPNYIQHPRPVKPKQQSCIPDATHTYKPLDNELTLPDQKPILEKLEQSLDFPKHRVQRTKTPLERHAKWEKHLDSYGRSSWNYLNSDEIHEKLNSESPTATLPDYFKTDKMADIRVFLQKSTLETNAKSFTRMLMDATRFFRNKWIWHRKHSVIPCTDRYSVRYIPDTLSQLANQGRVVQCIDYLQRWINDLESYLENCTCVYEAEKKLTAEYYIGFFKEYLEFFSVVSTIFDSMPREYVDTLHLTQCKEHTDR